MCRTNEIRRNQRQGGAPGEASEAVMAAVAVTAHHDLPQFSPLPRTPSRCT
jgi:hypothetical protein